ncbi:hypothetical protein T05_15617 [Trichinella murrelli]|uniref:SCAN domain-containing protein 3 n=1 Tax=Trichinella murrelli TaxID=144512 RepID=A0A0V0TN14_9BILA|nr:hypothetical protein T05_15617 [Trichinella murrelli]
MVRKFLLAFPSSYLVERGFSVVTDFLTKKRSRLQIDKRGDLRLFLTNIEPNRFLHQALKRRRGILQSERHDAELEESQGRGERRLLPVSFRDFNLPVAGHQVERAEPFGLCQRIHRIVYSRDGLGVDARHDVQSANAGNRSSSEPVLPVNSRGLRLVRLPLRATFPGLADPPPPAGLGEGGGVAASPAGPLRSRCGARQGSFLLGRPHRTRWPSRTS